MSKSTCGRCGFPIKKATALKSRHTQAIYCPDIGNCDRRARNELNLDEMHIALENLRGLLNGV